MQVQNESTQYDLPEAETRDEGIQCDLLSDKQKLKTCDQGTQYEPPIEAENTFKRLNTFPSFKEPTRRQPITRNYKSLSLLKTQLEKTCGELFRFESKQEELFEIKCKHPNRIKDRHLKELFKAFNLEFMLHDYSGFKTFYLDFEFCTELTGEAFKELADGGVTNFIDIQALWLNFHGCTNITDDKIKYLAQYLAESHPNLETLTLDLRLCTKISDEAIKEISNAIGKSVRGLKKLYLSFSGCKQLTNQAVEDLFLNIGMELKGLQVLSLKFNNCAEITDDSVDNILQLLQNDSLRLVEFSLELMGTKVQEETKELLLKTLQKNINKIYII